MTEGKTTLTQEEFDQEINLKPLNVQTMSRDAVGRLEAVTKLDYPLAWVSTVLPALGFVAAIALMVNGYGGALEISVLLFMAFFTQLGIVACFHRLCAHRGWNASPAVKAVLGIFGSMAFQGPIIWWAATHRRHHKISDQEGDPHSPNLFGEGFWDKARGLYHAHMGWLFEKDSMRMPGWHRYAQDLYRDKVVFWVHMNYFTWLVLGLVLPAVFVGLVTWSWMGVLLGFLWGGLARVFLTSHAIWGLNSFCHLFGMRPFEVKGDHSRNNLWLVLPTLGEGWHNNHHMFPSSAHCGIKWWQVDPAAYVIRGLEAVGLAWDVKQPTKEMIRKKEELSAARRQKMDAAGSEVESVVSS